MRKNIEETIEKNEKLISLFSASTKRSGEDFLADKVQKKLSAGSLNSLDEIPRNSFQNIFQITPYKSNFKKISPKNSPFSCKTPNEENEIPMDSQEKNEQKNKKILLRKIIKVLACFLSRVGVFIRNF